MIDVEAVKIAIGHQAGWEAMAKTIKASADPKKTREEYESVLRDIAADKRVDLPVLLKIPGDAMMITIEMGDYLCQQLDDNLRNLK